MTFPEQDLYVLLSLAAWNCPWAFPESDLASREVIMTTERELIERPFDRRRPPQSKRVMTPEEVKEYFGVQ